MRLLAERALLPDGWAEEVAIEVEDGAIAAVVPGGSQGERLGVVIPGMVDLHSHAFQRAMAGLTERLLPGEASFWSWREVMYRFLERIGPEEQLAIARQLFVELLEGGYTSVVEFHYLHHAPDGRPYDDRAAMSHAVVEAAREAGIGLTLLPALYMTGGFGGRPPDPGQERFLHDMEPFLRLVETLRAGEGPELCVGVAPHSLRAVPEEALSRVVAAAPGPVHIHLAEQPREVRDCLEHCGRRPVDRLLDLVEVDSRFCCIHATHMDEAEVVRLARTGAVAGLCPTTEANLGDGVFELPGFLDAGGGIGIGSDSNVSVGPVEELRLLEYGQRLALLRRSVAASDSDRHTGARLWRLALRGGAQASGRPVGALEKGRRADLLVLDPDHPALTGRRDDALLDSLVFGPSAGAIREVRVGGRVVVRDGRHVDRERAAAGFRGAMARLLA
jgi:formimidoylglutamate deiminase